MIERDVYRDGTVDYRFVRKFVQADEVVLFPEWVMAMWVNALLAVERFRRLASAPSVEFALELEILTKGVKIPLMGYGAQRLSPIGQVGKISVGSHPFPVYTLGSIDGFPEVVSQIEQDLSNLAGHDSPRDFTLEFGKLI